MDCEIRRWGGNRFEYRCAGIAIMHDIKERTHKSWSDAPSIFPPNSSEENTLIGGNLKQILHIAKRCSLNVHDYSVVGNTQAHMPLSGRMRGRLDTSGGGFFDTTAGSLLIRLPWDSEHHTLKRGEIQKMLGWEKKLSVNQLYVENMLERKWCHPKKTSKCGLSF